MPRKPLVPWKCADCGRSMSVVEGIRVICSCKSSNGAVKEKVGTILKNLPAMKAIGWVLAKIDRSCMCHTIEERMNKLGIEGCLVNFESIVEELHESAHMAGVPCHRTKIGDSQLRKWLHEAIEIAREQRESATKEG